MALAEYAFAPGWLEASFTSFLGASSSMAIDP